MNPQTQRTSYLQALQSLPLDQVEEIVVKFRGGLGNQLFQYAAGLALEKMTGAKLTTSLNNYNGRRWNPRYRNLPRRSFELKQIMRMPEKEVELPFRTFPASYLLRKKGSLPSFLSERYGYSFVTEFGGAVKLFAGDKSKVILEGFFQEDPTVTTVFPELMERLLRRRGICYPSADLSNSVGIHIRRGDYTSGLFDVEPVELNKVIAARKRCSDRRAVVFTDDPVWARAVLEQIGDAVLWEDADPIATFFAMSTCCNLIIANSSYSWWAARFNEKAERIFAPDPWFKQNSSYRHTEKHLYPPSWETY